MKRIKNYSWNEAVAEGIACNVTIIHSRDYQLLRSIARAAEIITLKNKGYSHRELCLAETCMRVSIDHLNKSRKP